MPSHIVRFASFELDTHSRELREGARRLRLQEQPFEILRVMLEHPGDVVTRDELRRRLWPDGTFVDFEHSLNAAVKRLRASLGDEADKPRFIETVPKRGYRFIAAIDRGSAATAGRRAASPRTRLVVLPFSNLSEDSGQEYFADGLTEELIAQLGPLCRGKVGIIARWSSMVFKGSLQRAREIGEALHADYILEGSARRDGQRVRITARLVETASESHLWSETYERTVGDLLAVQSDVASRVARSLVSELLPDTPRGRAPEEQPAAYQAYLRGRYHWAKPGDVGLVDALDAFEDAIGLAPDFAAAYSGLARVKVGSAEYYRAVPRTALAEARSLALRALELDTSVSEALGILADTRRMLDLDWDGAETAYTQALAINPSNESALRSYGVLLTLRSRHEEAAWQVDRACEIDPLCLVANTTAAWARYAAGDLDAAIDRCRHTLTLDREHVGAHRILGAACLRAGRCDDARAAFQAAVHGDPTNPVGVAWLAHFAGVTGARAEAQALIERAWALERSRYVSHYHVALAYVGLGDQDLAMASLDQAWLDRDPALPTIVVEPRFDPLRTHPRYAEFLERLNLGDPGSRVPSPGSRVPDRNLHR